MGWLDVVDFTPDLLPLLTSRGAFARAPIAAIEQLQFVARQAEKNGARSIAFETAYVDRDFMEEFSTFYSRNLTAYRNSCTRLHFFRTRPAKTMRELRRLGGGAYSKAEYVTACQQFSRDVYVGFSVIKPLGGTPVGRTVIRVDVERDEESGKWTEFPSARTYHAHFVGVDLTVHGLAFQQQDVGVSACATTALWSSLNKARELEDIGPSTPAQITNVAAQHALPLGRAMPSEGLSVDQMCQAVRAIGLSPYLFRCDEQVRPHTLVYSAVKSGFAPVLVLQRLGERREALHDYHAVTAVGAAFEPVMNPHDVVEDSGTWLKSQEMRRIFVHDDRYGPTLPAHIGPSDDGTLELRPEWLDDESWAIREVLLPLHAKIRLSLVDLYAVALSLAARMADQRARQEHHERVSLDFWIRKGVDYFDDLRFGQLARASAVQKWAAERTYSRYVGVVRFSASDFGTIDVLVDTTSTLQNLSFLRVVALGKSRKNTAATVRLLDSQIHMDLS